MEVYKAGQFTSESFDAMDVQSENILEEVCMYLGDSFVRSRCTHRFKSFVACIFFLSNVYQDLYGQSFFILFHHFVCCIQIPIHIHNSHLVGALLTDFDSEAHSSELMK